MSILIKKSGILSTIQDKGRIGFRRFGINPNGVMDRTAASLINILLENDENAAVIEMHFPTSEIVFENDAVFALGGAEFEAQLDGGPIANWQVHQASKGSTLSVLHRSYGSRSYLAIAGGFQVKMWLGSSSTNLSAKIGGTDGRKLEPGDRIEFNSNRRRSYPPQMISPSLIPKYSRFPTVRVVRGGEFEMLGPKSKELFEILNFQISNSSNRMGYRLIGEPLSLVKPVELLSSAANFGTIQLLPDGQLIILMADHQTTGGYPRIANVIGYDLPLLAQVGPNDKIAFHLIDIVEAERITAAFQRELKFLKTGVSLCTNLQLGK